MEDYIRVINFIDDIIPQIEEHIFKEIDNNLISATKLLERHSKILGFINSKQDKKSKALENKNSCSSFVSKNELEICLMVEKRIISNQAKIKEKKSFNNTSKELTSSLQSSINEKSKIKYLDQ
jgi:hypothetical protein